MGYWQRKSEDPRVLGETCYSFGWDLTKRQKTESCGF